MSTITDRNSQVMHAKHTLMNPFFFTDMFLTLILRSCVLCHYHTSMCMLAWCVESIFKVRIALVYVFVWLLGHSKVFFFFGFHRPWTSLSCLHTQCTSWSSCVSESSYAQGETDNKHFVSWLPVISPYLIINITNITLCCYIFPCKLVERTLCHW